MRQLAHIALAATIALAGCSKPDQADPNVDHDAAEKAVPDDFTPASPELIAEAEGPPSCDDARIKRMVVESFIESVAKPTAEIELRAIGVGVGGWPGSFDKAFQDRIHLAAVKYNVVNASPAGFNAATKAQDCTARVVFSEAGLDGIESINTAYTIELAAPGGPYQVRSAFRGHPGLAGGNQVRWHMAVSLKAMFDKEIQAAEKASAVAAPESPEPAQTTEAVSSPPSHP